MRNLFNISILAIALGFSLSTNAKPLSQPVNVIAKEAYIYAYPLIENYKAMYVTAVDTKSSQYKAPFNTLVNLGLATPKDTAVVTPNSDTPYSLLWADLRSEPLVLGVPKIDDKRYYSLQFVDLYTYNFAYVGTRTTGNDEGKYLLVGPKWRGKVPTGIKKVIQADTDFVFVIYRTQLFAADDMENVNKIQTAYSVVPLSKYLNQAPATPAPNIHFPKLSAKKLQSPEFFNYLNFLLQYAPTLPADKSVRAQFAKIGIEPGKPFVPANPEEIIAGMNVGKATLDAATKKIVSADNLFGTRDSMHNNFLNRAMGAKFGLYGNIKEEASYFNYRTDSQEQILNSERDRYIIHFGKNALPPVNAFWSVTIYDAKTQLLVANPINRYLINSAMLAKMHHDKDGSLSIYIQHNQPTKDKFSNWLPAPAGPFYLVLRLYWPKEAVLNGTWTPPVVRKI